MASQRFLSSAGCCASWSTYRFSSTPTNIRSMSGERAALFFSAETIGCEGKARRAEGPSLHAYAGRCVHVSSKCKGARKAPAQGGAPVARTPIPNHGGCRGRVQGRKAGPGPGKQPHLTRILQAVGALHRGLHPHQANHQYLPAVDALPQASRET